MNDSMTANNPEFTKKPINMNPLKSWNPTQNNVAMIALGVCFALLLFLAFRGFTMPTVSTTTAQATPPTLTEQLQTVYQDKLNQRLIKSDLLVQLAASRAQTAKLEAELTTANQQITSLNDKEIALSKLALNSINATPTTK